MRLLLKIKSRFNEEEQNRAPSFITYMNYR